MVRRPFESKVQDLVYSVDVGTGFRILRGVLGVLGLLLVVGLFTMAQFKGLREAEAMDYAQAGRNLAFRNGFFTDTVRPFSVGYLRTKSPPAPAYQAQQRVGNTQVFDRHPDLYHAPVYPLLLSAGFKLVKGAFQTMDPRTGAIFQPERWVVIPVNHAFALLTGVFVWLIARRLFDPKVAGLSLLAYALSRVVWEDSLAAVGLPVAAFFGAGAFYFALRAGSGYARGEGLRPWIVWFLLSAGFCALAFLTRYGMLALLPGLLLFFGFIFRRRWAWLVVFLALFAAAVSPWIVRNLRVSGQPLGLAPYTALYDTRLSEGTTIDRQLAPGASLRERFYAVRSKMVVKFGDYYRGRLGELADGWLLPLFLIAVFHRFARREAHLLRWGVLLSMLALFVIACAFGDSTWRLLRAFLPAMIPFAVGFFVTLVGRMQLRLRIQEVGLNALLIGFTAVPLVLALLPPRVSWPYPPYYAPYISYACRLMRPEAQVNPAEPGGGRPMICTDMPWATAWYGGRVSLLMPATVDSVLTDSFDLGKTIDVMYFTTLTIGKPLNKLRTDDTTKTWFEILFGQLPQTFPTPVPYVKLNNMDQLVFINPLRVDVQGPATTP